MIEKCAKIGYELNMKGAFTYDKTGDKNSAELDVEDFRKHPENYEIIDIRNESEWKEGKLFENARHIPLHDLRQEVDKVNAEKPVVVHCAGGYRSAAGASILEAQLEDTKVYDLSTDIEDFK